MVFVISYLNYCRSLLSLKNVKLNTRLRLYSNKIEDKLLIKSNLPKSINQIKYMELLRNDSNSLIVCHGPAGSGKTLLSCMNAIDNFNKKRYDKIIITRPVTNVDEELGFLPGDLYTKMSPYIRPIIDIFSEYYTQNEIMNLMNSNRLEIVPLAFMRGRTFKNCYIIADEMQNSTPNQMLMLLTRLGVNSRMVINGDIHQSDIHSRTCMNGLSDFLSKYNMYYDENKKSINNEFIKIIELNDSDIQRSDLVKEVLNIYNFKKKYKQEKYNQNIKDDIQIDYNAYNKLYEESYCNRMNDYFDKDVIDKYTVEYDIIRRV